MLPTPVDAIALFARSRPSKVAAANLVTGESWTYTQLDQAVGRLAGYLLQRGCVAGDRVAVLARNSVSQVMLHFACARAGLIYVPFNWRLSGGELEDLIARSRPSVLLCDEQSGPLLAGRTDVESLSTFLAESENAAPMVDARRDLDRPSLILFTSGTSGSPKGVLLTERNLLQSAISFSMMTSVDGNSRFLCEAPMFHTIGLVANIRPVLQQGGSIVVSDGYQPERTYQWLCDRELGITHYVGVPQMIEGFRSLPGFNARQLAHLTGLVTGGAPHAASDIEAWLDDGVPLVCGYGMSEAGSVFGMPVDPDVLRTKLGAAGIPSPLMEARLVDSDGEDCGPGQAGELWLRSESILDHYWEADELTRESFAPGNWFRTGDIARCDEDGFFWIVDRKKDMIISGGENIYPAEIEALLVGYPGIREAAVVGIADDKWGEVGCLVIAEETPGTVDDATMLDYFNQHLARYKVPKRIVRAESLPRTPTGKLQKPKLKNWLCAQ